MNVRCAWTTLAPTFFCHVDEENDDAIILSLRDLPLVLAKTIFDLGVQMGGSGETVFHDKGHDQFQEAGGKRSFNTTNELLTLKHMKRFLGI